MIDGSKTYLVSAATLVYAALSVFLGEMEVHTAIQYFLASGALAGIRSAMKKGENGPPRLCSTSSSGLGLTSSS